MLLCIICTSTLILPAHWVVNTYTHAQLRTHVLTAGQGTAITAVTDCPVCGLLALNPLSQKMSGELSPELVAELSSAVATAVSRAISARARPSQTQEAPNRSGNISSNSSSTVLPCHSVAAGMR